MIVDLPFNVPTTCISVPARSAASTAVGLTVAVSPHVFCVGLYLATCCENVFALSGFCVICVRCMHGCLKLPNACSVGSFEKEARVPVTPKLTVSFSPLPGVGIGGAASRRQILLSRELDQYSYCRFGAFFLTSGRDCLVTSVLIFVKYTF
jgi:hypothetical protein